MTLTNTCSSKNKKVTTFSPTFKQSYSSIIHLKSISLRGQKSTWKTQVIRERNGVKFLIAWTKIQLIKIIFFFQIFNRDFPRTRFNSPKIRPKSISSPWYNSIFLTSDPKHLQHPKSKNGCMLNSNLRYPQIHMNPCSRLTK